MQITDIRLHRRVDALNNLLESRFGLRIDSMDPQHLAEVRQHYMAKRAAMLETLGEAVALRHPVYAKSVMISEAAGQILREIRPTRRKRKSKPRS